MSSPWPPGRRFHLGISRSFSEDNGDSKDVVFLSVDVAALALITVLVNVHNNNGDNDSNSLSALGKIVWTIFPQRYREERRGIPLILEEVVGSASKAAIRHRALVAAVDKLEVKRA